MKNSPSKIEVVLTFVFVIVASLLFGGLVGRRIGESGNGRLIVQRDKALRLAEEFKGLLDATEKNSRKCSKQLDSLYNVAMGCCSEVERALRERDACDKKVDGKERQR